jgi:hypothetical protein
MEIRLLVAVTTYRKSTPYPVRSYCLDSLAISRPPRTFCQSGSIGKIFNPLQAGTRHLLEEQRSIGNLPIAAGARFGMKPHVRCADVGRRAVPLILLKALTGCLIFGAATRQLWATTISPSNREYRRCLPSG